MVEPGKSHLNWVGRTISRCTIDADFIEKNVIINKRSRDRVWHSEEPMGRPRKNEGVNSSSSGIPKRFKGQWLTLQVKKHYF